ncbi:MAG: PIN domain-containing protein [Methanosarcinales archaeon]|nr:PIN domain-containing protein [Methanosarcinales archaeon]
MNRILIDTMYISALLTDEDDSYHELAQVIDDEKIAGLVSVVTLTELVTILGIKIYKEKINQLITSKLVFININQIIAVRAGELHLKYGLPTADSLIAATGLIENVEHIVTDDSHFIATKNLIKPIDLKKALKLASK